MTFFEPGITPSQTVGPFFLGCLLRADMCRNTLAGPETTGERMRLEGLILDGAGEPVPDAIIEIWQADASGRYHHPVDRRAHSALDPNFDGFGRCGTDERGEYWFETIKPGVARPDAGGDAPDEAAHIAVLIFARGLLNHLVTRVYFAGSPANDSDPTLARVPFERRDTLLARPSSVDGQQVYRWDIRLQGPGETVFFNW